MSIIIISIISLCLGAFAQDIPPAPADKAVVYFARVSSLGFAINFSYFDSARLIGKFNGPKYIRYECEPGRHLFWARSENRDFVEAEVEAGKIYFIEAVPEMGALKASVRLDPIDPNDVARGKKVSKILKLLKKRSAESFTAEELASETKEDVIKRGLERYQEEKGQTTISRLDKTMYYTPAQN